MTDPKLSEAIRTIVREEIASERHRAAIETTLADIDRRTRQELQLLGEEIGGTWGMTHDRLVAKARAIISNRAPARVTVTAEDVTGALSDIGRTLGWPTDADVFASALTARLAARGKA